MEPERHVGDATSLGGMVQCLRGRVGLCWGHTRLSQSPAVSLSDCCISESPGCLQAAEFCHNRLPHVCCAPSTVDATTAASHGLPHGCCAPCAVDAITAASHGLPHVCGAPCAVHHHCVVDAIMATMPAKVGQSGSYKHCCPCTLLVVPLPTVAKLT